MEGELEISHGGGVVWQALQVGGLVIWTGGAVVDVSADLGAIACTLTLLSYLSVLY